MDNLGQLTHCGRTLRKNGCESVRRLGARRPARGEMYGKRGGELGGRAPRPAQAEGERDGVRGYPMWSSMEGAPEEEEGDEAKDDVAHPWGALPRWGEDVAALGTAVGGTGNPSPAGRAIALAELPDIHGVFEVHHGYLVTPCFGFRRDSTTLRTAATHPSASFNTCLAQKRWTCHPAH